ncbi:MAG: PolC-type DNA polymerase III [Tissierellales bacterium]|nr:PolC-type DNA polymerase III [Tissierellales bacterium]
MNSRLNLKEFIEKQSLKLDNINCYSNIELERVLVDRINQKLILKLIGRDLAKNEWLETFRKKLVEKYSEFSDINYDMTYECKVVDFDDERKTILGSLIRKYVSDRFVSCNGWINQCDINIEANLLEFNIHQSLPKAVFDKRKSEIDKAIRMQYGSLFDSNLEILFSESQKTSDIDYEKEKEALEKKYVEQIKIEKPEKREVKVDTNGGESHEVKAGLFYGKKIDEAIEKIAELNTNSGEVTVKGEVFGLEIKEIKGNKKIYTFNITDYTYSIGAKLFANEKQQPALDANLKNGEFYKVRGDVIYDTFSKSVLIGAKAIAKSVAPKSRQDLSEHKRVELHCHTQMSDMDGMTSISDIAKLAAEWGHKALAITDHGVVQAFPEGMGAGKKNGIKMLYGMEGYLVNDGTQLIDCKEELPLYTEFVVFDLETTGFSPITNKITEIGAVKIVEGKIVDRYSQLVNPEEPIPLKIQELTGITNNLVENEPTIENCLKDFLNFVGDAVLVAHNASFDMSFLKENARRIGEDVRNPSLDTLQLSRILLKNLKSHKLNRIAKHLNISLENHHRAVDDSAATGEILLKFLDMLKSMNYQKLHEINELAEEHLNYKNQSTYHIIILAKNAIGIKNLYHLVSESHIDYYYRRPRLPRSIIEKYREGLILGTACEAGELFKAVLRGASDEEVKTLVDFYDFLEIQPIGNNQFMLDQGTVKTEEDLRNFNRKIVEYGEMYEKPVVATGDVHFLNPEDEIYRRILMAGKGFSDADKQPPLYFKSTDEMLKEFNYLGSDKAFEVVVTNTNKIADEIEDLKPIPDETFPPVLEGSDKELRDICYAKANDMYGEPLPEIVKDRLERELSSIIGNGYSVLYIISQKLVWKSNDSGYLVGSRGSVGSSFAATMSGITEVNPLQPHYYCKKCKYSEFQEDGTYGSGVDMPDKTCPKCGEELTKDGFDIPFETFLGFEGDKEPDIDLNFAGPAQTEAHQYTEELFGEGYVYRAGTIGTIAEKTAYGFIKKYYDEREKPLNRAEADRLVRGCTGIKRTTGQHPGGVMVVPNYKDIHDFTPIQYPANDSKSGTMTTHFDYHSISGRILKLDILGHETPYIIRMLEQFTNTNAQDIPLDDKETMGIFLSTDSLKVTPEQINSPVGTYAIPEFGTKFVRQMLVDTKPTTFSELIQISGLSHGTDVWLNNAQDLVRAGITTLKSAISTRDDIMVYLIYKGVEKKLAFTIMEKVRKGKGLIPEYEDAMREHDVPEWYIDSCKKIKYMFPKAHAAAYVMMSFRIAYYKVHYPEAFYATYFTMKWADFDADLIIKGADAILEKIKELEQLGNSKTAKEKNSLTVLEVALEMWARNIKMKKADLYASDSDEFTLDEEGIIPPLKALQGVGENAAKSIVQARGNGKFISKEDIVNRAKVSKTVIEAMTQHGCLDGMQEKNQLSLLEFDF